MAQYIEQVTGGHVIKAFDLSTRASGRGHRRCSMNAVWLCCGDDHMAADLTRRLIADVDCEPLRVGELTHAHHLETKDRTCGRACSAANVLITSKSFVDRNGIEIQR